MNNVVSLSGGKDSTAMLHLMLERGESIHSVVFFDTGWEFPEMHDHIDLVEKKTGIGVVRLSPEKPFNHWMYERVKTKGRIGEVGYCWPNTFDRWCTELKTRQIDKFTRKIRDIQQCIGLAADELHRVKKNTNKRYPLIEYGITEADAIKYCRKLGYTWGGLYDIFNRVSCWCCPLQSIKDLRKLRKHRPELWAKLLEMDARQPSHSPGFKDYWRVQELEDRFGIEDRLAVIFPNKFVRLFSIQKKQRNLFEIKGGRMNPPIFKVPRRGLMGSKPLGAEYMGEVKERARRMKAAAKKDTTDPRQLRLPYPPLQLKLPFPKK